MTVDLEAARAGDPATLEALLRGRIGTAYRSRGGHHWPTQRRDTLPLPSHPVSIPPNSPSYP